MFKIHLNIRIVIENINRLKIFLCHRGTKFPLSSSVGMLLVSNKINYEMLTYLLLSNFSEISVT